MVGILEIEYIFLFEPVQKNLTILGLFLTVFSHSYLIHSLVKTSLEVLDLL